MHQVGGKQSTVRITKYIPPCLQTILNRRFHKRARETSFSTLWPFCSASTSKQFIVSVLSANISLNLLHFWISPKKSFMWVSFSQNLYFQKHNKTQLNKKKTSFKRAAADGGSFFFFFFVCVAEKLPPGVSPPHPHPHPHLLNVGIWNKKEKERKNVPALPASPHKRRKRVESPHHSSPQLVTMGATRGRKGGYYKHTCILHPPLSKAHINTHQSDLMCCTFPPEHLGNMQKPLEN